MKTTSISIWYRRGASGVRTTLRNVFGTGEGPLGYEPHSKRVRYRRGASGVRTTLRNMCGTGEGSLGYELLSGTCLVQERGLWGTNYSPERVWYRRGASGVRTTLRNVFGTRRASGVRTTLRSMFGTGEGPLMYGMLHKTPLV